MSQIYAEISQILNARPEQIDAVLTDYHNGERAIQPQPYFMDLRATESTNNRGTLVEVKVNFSGHKHEFKEVVSKPIPLHLIMEYDAEYETMVIIIVEPIIYTEKTRITISTIYVSHASFTSFMSELLIPGNLHHIYEFHQFIQSIEEQDMVPQAS